MVRLPKHSPVGRADLHNHTTASDGTLSPSEQVRWAKEQGLAAVGITDHDTIAAWSEAMEAGEALGIEVLPGCELSTEVEKTEIHILAYLFDPEEPEMKALLERMRGGRRARAKAAVERLHALGFTQVSLERVLELGGESVGRPHLAQAMVEAGMARSLAEAFDRYLVRGKPAYVPRPKLEPAEAIDLVLAAGGVPVIAHPGLIRNDHWVRRLLDAGAMGLEAYHSDHSDYQRQFYARWGLDRGLIVTGGTDSHGPAGARTVVPGEVNVSMEVVEQLKRASRHWQSRSA